LSWLLIRRCFASAQACGALVLLPLLLVNVAPAQVGAVAPKLDHLYIESFGNKLDAADLKGELIRELRRAKEIDLVNSPAAANAVLVGDAEIYIRGYISLYARAGTSPQNGSPIYGGYASVELKNPSGEVLWSYLVTVRGGSKDAAHELSKDIVRHLLASLSGTVEKK
jgi:hypothetical protein